MRKRWIWNHVTGECREVSDDYTAMTRDYRYMPDLDSVYGGGFKSPIDGEFITSRSQLRAHERKHGVKQCGDYKPGELIGRENKRVERIREMARTGDPLKWM